MVQRKMRKLHITIEPTAYGRETERQIKRRRPTDQGGHPQESGESACWSQPGAVSFVLWNWSVHFK